MHSHTVCDMNWQCTARGLVFFSLVPRMFVPLPWLNYRRTLKMELPIQVNELYSIVGTILLQINPLNGHFLLLLCVIMRAQTAATIWVFILKGMKSEQTIGNRMPYTAIQCKYVFIPLNECPIARKIQQKLIVLFLFFCRSSISSGSHSANKSLIFGNNNSNWDEIEMQTIQRCLLKWC